jgi:hypothetical protein
VIGVLGKDGINVALDLKCRLSNCPDLDAALGNGPLQLKYNGPDP